MPPPPLVLFSPLVQPLPSKCSSGDCVQSPSISIPMVYQTNSAPDVKSDSSSSIPRKPRPFTYSVSTLLELPRRLSHPPRALKSSSGRPSVVPEMDVSLEDILNMRHISPLSLKDFEQYLLFEEYGAENLYFILWMKDYTSRFNTGAGPAQLLISIARAKATFFSPESQYELNLAASRVSEFLTSAGSPESGVGDKTSGHSSYPTNEQTSCPLLVTAPSPTPPHPSAFTGVFNDVEHMLRISARRFVRARSRNVGSQRAYCVVFGGLQTIAIALAPLLVSLLNHKGRWIRFGVLPPLWMGLTVLICSLNGLCMVVYLMGGSRQLHPFELHRPPISGPLPYTPRSPYTHSFTTADTFPDIKSPVPCVFPPPRSTTSLSPPGLVVHGPFDADGSSTTNLQHAQSYTLPEIRPASPISDIFEFETAGFIPAQDSDATSINTRTDAESTVAASSTYVDHSYSDTRSRSSTPKLMFDFDSLPLKTLDSSTGPLALQAARGSGVKGMIGSVFAPLTHIESPVVSRAQWEVVMRSSAIATFIALVITGVLVAIPV